MSEKKRKQPTNAMSEFLHSDSFLSAYKQIYEFFKKTNGTEAFTAEDLSYRLGISKAVIFYRLSELASAGYLRHSGYKPCVAGNPALSFCATQILLCREFNYTEIRPILGEPEDNKEVNLRSRQAIFSVASVKMAVLNCAVLSVPLRFWDNNTLFQIEQLERKMMIEYDTAERLRLATEIIIQANEILSGIPPYHKDYRDEGA